MLHADALGLLVGAVALGFVHGVEPGHGWPVAATYALDRSNKWLYGFAASFILGIGHLISSIAVVAAFFYAKAYFELAQVNEPITVVGDLQIGGPVSLVAGTLLIALGVREYYFGHSHGTPGDDHGTPRGDGGGHDHAHTHDHADEHNHGKGQGHQHDHSADHTHDHNGGDGHDNDRVQARIVGVLPFVGGHTHDQPEPESAADRGLLGIAWFAFVLGFAHEEEFEIIALCAGSRHCLELMLAYATAVIVGIVGLTMLLIGGYEHYEERVERLTPYLPAFSAVVLVAMGLGFISGLF